MTRTQEREMMRELLSALGAKGVAALAAEVLEERSSDHRKAAGETLAANERARQVVLCGKLARDANALRRLAESELSERGIVTVPAYLPTAFDRWNVNELYVRPGGTLGRKWDKRLDPDATAALRKVYGSDTAAFHDDAQCWLAVNVGA